MLRTLLLPRNRSGIYEDMTLLLEGVTAWFDGDLIPRASMVLVPQIEAGLRAIVGRLEKPVTKKHPSIPDVSVVINMGDILYSKELSDLLGPDLTIYFLSLYADPRGMNLRNRIAHGMVKSESIRQGPLLWVIHTLFVFGVWKELAENRR